MRTLFHSARVVALAALIIGFSHQTLAQESRKEPSGAISGRVMLGDKPVPRVVVMLTPSNQPVSTRTPPARATTDEDGNYRVTKVPPGSYNVMPYTLAFVVPTEAAFGGPGKNVTLGEGEEVDGVDFSLTKGGVITGRVTDADGRPVIEQRVNILRVDERGQRVVASSYFNYYMFTTDDRGVYRLYGLTPGRYKVSAGEAMESGSVRFGFGGGTYKRTFHPDVADESRAAIVEVKAGGESSDIDIKLGSTSKTFVATGRVVDADSGKPLSNVMYGYGALVGQQQTLGAYGWTNNRTNADGQFRIDGLNAGRFAAFAVSTEQSDFYSEPAVFEVTDSDVNGLEIKVRRGSSISGLAVIEGSDNADVLSRLSKLELRVFVQTQDVSSPIVAPISIGPDGSFRITGLRPGKVHITLATYPTPQKGFSLLRVEREGVTQQAGIEVGSGENVSGVRVVIGYGTAVVRGQIKVQGNEPTPDLRFRVLARRLADEGPMSLSATADVRGSFRFEGLIAGQYELTVLPMYVTPSSSAGPPAPGRIPQMTLAKQIVTVAEGTETEVTLNIDLGERDKGNEK
jgi:hypothetical protein